MVSLPLVYTNLLTSFHLPLRPFAPYPVGILAVYRTEGTTYFFGLKIYTLGIFLGQEICHASFRCFKSLFDWIIRIEAFKSCICLGWKFWCQVFFLGVKFKAYVLFWVCNMKLRRSPPPFRSCILRVSPWGLPLSPIHLFFGYYRIICNFFLFSLVLHVYEIMLSPCVNM